MFFVFYFYQKNIQNLAKKVLVDNRLNKTSHTHRQRQKEKEIEDGRRIIALWYVLLVELRNHYHRNMMREHFKMLHINTPAYSAFKSLL